MRYWIIRDKATGELDRITREEKPGFSTQYFDYLGSYEEDENGEPIFEDEEE